MWTSLYPYHINRNSAAGQGWKSFPKDNANPPTGLRNSEYHTFLRQVHSTRIHYSEIEKVGF
jgi:hypothetical protein